MGKKSTKEKRALRTAVFLLSAMLLMVPAILPQNTAIGEPHVNSLSIETTIKDNYAVTELSEVISNPNYDSIWTQFSIKLPENMFISNFTMVADGKTYYGVVVPKAVGEQEFQGAVSNGSDAALLSYSDGIFSYSLSISPYQSINISMRYEGYIEKKLGGYEYDIPFSGMYMPSADSLSLSVDIISADRVISLYVPDYNAITDLSDPEIAKVRYDARGFQPSNDMNIFYETNAPPVNGTLLSYGGESGYFMHIFSPQVDYLGSAMPKDIIFVLDKSGSMRGTKMDQMKEAFSTIIGELPEQDDFNIIVFNDRIVHYYSELLPANQENKDAAVRYIDALEADGSTNIDGAMLSAINMFSANDERLPIIVMLTDGLPTVGVTDTSKIRQDILEANEAGVSVFSLGFGDDVDFDFLRAMSLENNGIAVKIFVNEDASEQITGFYDTISTPLLKDIRISYSGASEGDSVFDVHPTYVRQMFSGTEVVIVGKYTGNHTISNISARTWNGTMKFSQEFALSGGDEYDFIPHLWAYMVINELLDKIAVEGETSSLVENITSVAMQYGFVTPYTSMLIKADTDQDDDSNPPDEGYVYDDGSGSNFFNPPGNMGGSGSATPPDQRGGSPTPDDSGENTNSTGYNQAPLFMGAVALAALLFGSINRRRKKH